MLYAIISKQPFIYVYNEDEELLKSDYEFIVENPDDCDIHKEFIPEDYKALTPSEFTAILDAEAMEEFVYTFDDGRLVTKYYRKAPYFYVYRARGAEYPTYCDNPNTIKAGLMNNRELLAVLDQLISVYSCDESLMSSEVPEELPNADGSVVAYICVPVVMKKIPIGIESEEEHQEILEEEEDYEE